MSVELSHDAYFKWHMPISEEICRAGQEYMPLFGTDTDRDFRQVTESDFSTYYLLKELQNEPCYSA